MLHSLWLIDTKAFYTQVAYKYFWHLRFGLKFQEKPLVKSIFSAMRPCTSGMVMSVFASVFSMAVLQWDLFRVNYDFSLLVNLEALAVYVVSLCVLFKRKLHPVFIILFGAAAGIIFF